MVLADGREQGISVPGQRALMTCQKQVHMLTQQLSSGVDNLGTEIGDIVRKLADVDAQMQAQQGQMQQVQAPAGADAADAGAAGTGAAGAAPADAGTGSGGRTSGRGWGVPEGSAGYAAAVSGGYGTQRKYQVFSEYSGALEEQGDGRSYDLNALRKYLRVIVWFQLITIVLIVLRILGLL